MQGSSAGGGRLLMRQRKALPSCSVPALVKPASCRALIPVPGVPGAQPRKTPWPQCEKSTITVTPDVVVHDDIGAAVAGPTATANAAIVVTPTTASARRHTAIAHGRTCSFASRDGVS
jgi:hypothetical protein